MACDSVGGDSESAEGEDASVDVVAGKGGERITKEMIQGWVNSATGKVCHAAGAGHRHRGQ